jgi:hypothetical protein
MITTRESRNGSEVPKRRALTKVPEDFFVRHPLEVQVTLAAINDPCEIRGRLLKGGRSAVAARLAGAFAAFAETSLPRRP